MVTIELALDRSGKRIDDLTRDGLPAALGNGVSFVWIDADAMEEDALASLQRDFGLHTLALEDAVVSRQRAKYRLYDDMLYLEFYGIALEGEEIEAREVAMFVARNFVITVRQGGLPNLDGVHQRWSDYRAETLAAHLAGHDDGDPAPIGLHLRRSPMMLAYTILDELVDNYFPPVEWMGDEIERLQDEVIEGRGRQHQLAIHKMRTRIFQVRRLLAPEQEVLNMLLRRDVPLVEDEMVPYFADIHDHLLRIYDWTESYREQLSTIVDLQLGMQSHRLNRTVRTLTVWSIILMATTLIAGIYGMNFTHMPELDWRFGYPLALGLMLAIGVGLGLVFKRLDWW
jgi:magnesium transporter